MAVSARLKPLESCGQFLPGDFSWTRTAWNILLDIKELNEQRRVSAIDDMVSFWQEKCAQDRIGSDMAATWMAEAVKLLPDRKRPAATRAILDFLENAYLDKKGKEPDGAYGTAESMRSVIIMTMGRYATDTPVARTINFIKNHVGDARAAAMLIRNNAELLPPDRRSPAIRSGVDFCIQSTRNRRMNFWEATDSLTEIVSLTPAGRHAPDIREAVTGWARAQAGRLKLYQDTIDTAGTKPKPRVTWNHSGQLEITPVSGAGLASKLRQVFASVNAKPDDVWPSAKNRHRLSYEAFLKQAPN